MEKGKGVGGGGEWEIIGPAPFNNKNDFKRNHQSTEFYRVLPVFFSISSFS